MAGWRVCRDPVFRVFSGRLACLRIGRGRELCPGAVDLQIYRANQARKGPNVASDKAYSVIFHNAIVCITAAL